MKDLFSPLEVAGILDIHVKTVRRYLRDETIKGIKIGGSWKVSKEELGKLLDHPLDDETQYSEKSSMKGNEKIMKSLAVNIEVKSNIEGNTYAQALMKIINSNDYSNCKFKYDMHSHVAKFMLSGSTAYLNAMMNKIDEIEKRIEKQ